MTSASPDTPPSISLDETNSVPYFHQIVSKFRLSWSLFSRTERVDVVGEAVRIGGISGIVRILQDHRTPAPLIGYKLSIVSQLSRKSEASQLR